MRTRTDFGISFRRLLKFEYVVVFSGIYTYLKGFFKFLINVDFTAV